MPFKSKKQKSYMKARKPKIYRNWRKKYGNKTTKKRKNKRIRKNY